MGRLTLALAIAALLVAAAPASALDVRLRQGVLSVTAAAGETNVVTVTRTATGATVADANNQVAANSACVPASGANTVDCTGAIGDFEVELGDRNDALRIAGATSATLRRALVRDGPGNDVMVGGDEVDVVSDTFGNDTYDLGGERDVLRPGGRGRGFVGNNVAYGGPGRDTLDGGGGHDRFYGGPERDKLVGFNGNDTLDGQEGDDSLFGSNGNDRLLGGQGFDRLLGGTGGDRLYGGADNDTLFGELGDDRLFGGPGMDLLSGGPGNNTLVQ
jgi:Ca2+-binding RTX toxin-like protein